MQKVVVFEHKISLRVFDTQFGEHDMENIGEIWYCLITFLTHHGPSSVLVLVSSNMIVLFFNNIPKVIPSGGYCKYCRFSELSVGVTTNIDDLFLAMVWG